MLKTVLIGLTVVGIVTAVGLAWAKHSGHCSAAGRINHITERIGRKLELIENQQGQPEAFADTLRGLRSQRHDHRQAMQDHITELLSASSLDRERAAALIDERHQAMDANKRVLVDAFADFSDSHHLPCYPAPVSPD